MLSSEPLQVQVTPVVFDFLFIEVKTKPAGDVLIHYKISDHNDRLVRKGSFKGILIQLRLLFLKDGNYKIEFQSQNFEPVTLEFEKKNANNQNGMI